MGGTRKNSVLPFYDVAPEVLVADGQRPDLALGAAVQLWRLEWEFTNTSLYDNPNYYKGLSGWVSMVLVNQQWPNGILDPPLESSRLMAGWEQASSVRTSRRWAGARPWSRSRCPGRAMRAEASPSADRPGRVTATPDQDGGDPRHRGVTGVRLDVVRVALVHNLPPGGARRVVAEHAARFTFELLEFCPLRLAGHRQPAHRPSRRALRGSSPGSGRHYDISIGCRMRAWRTIADLVNDARPDVVLAHPCRYQTAPLALRWTAVQASTSAMSRDGSTTSRRWRGHATR